MSSTSSPTLTHEHERPAAGSAVATSALPLFFGSAQRPLAGWYHAARPHTKPNLGVVICPPFGYEMMRTYRACRQLAQQLADGGIATLRFDYDGTGDSAGSDDDPYRVEAWTDSIGLAIEELKARSGITDVILCGVRFGALLAAQYARWHPVEGLVLVAPFTSGRAFVREQRAVAAMHTNRSATEEEKHQDVVGYRLTNTTIADLGRIDLVKGATHAASHALIVGREELPGFEQPLVQALQGAGVEVTATQTTAYAAMVEDPHKTVVPTELWNDIVQWVQRVPTRPRLALASSPAVSPSQGRTSRIPGPNGPVRESFLADGNVFGVLTRPLDDASSPSGPANVVTRMHASWPTILLLNIGSNHHAGSHRLYVTMARTWAALGYQVLRLDVSGIGDSAADVSADGIVYSTRAIDDVRRAMDMLEATHGVKRFVLCGLCSGAYMAYHTALNDPRVTGLALVNLATFEWHEGDSLGLRQRTSFKSTQFYKRALMDPSTWRRLGAGDVNARGVLTELTRRVSARTTGAWSRLAASASAGAPPVTVADNMRTLCRRGTRVLMVFDAADGGIDVMEAALGGGASIMKREPLFQLAIVEDADHTFTGREARSALMDILSAYLDGVCRGPLPAERP
ncbi:MAG: alpha/beta hydrolase [Vicinamibacterales bacterium]